MHRAIGTSLFGLIFALAGCSSKEPSDEGGTGATGGSAMQTGGTGGGGATGGTGGTGGSSGTGGTGGSSGTGGTGGTGGGAMCTGTTIVASPADNYKFHSDLTINVTKVKPSSELTFDWSGVTKDLLGHDVDLSTIGMVEIALWNLTLEQFEKKLNDDSLALMNLAIIATIIPSGPTDRTGSIYELTEMGQPVVMSDIQKYLSITDFPPESHIYTAMVADGMDYGKGTRMLTGFQLDATSTNTQVNITSDSTHLMMTADMHSLVSPTVPVGNPNITIDWTNMDTDVNPANTTAAGLPFDPTQITEVRVGKYSKSIGELEMQSNFLNLDAIADTMYRASVPAGTSLDLSKAKDPNGASFPGIDATANWIIALNCGECANPAPWYLTVVKPCAAP
jgi:hypothetical protein